MNIAIIKSIILNLYKDYSNISLSPCKCPNNSLYNFSSDPCLLFYLKKLFGKVTSFGYILQQKNLHLTLLNCQEKIVSAHYLEKKSWCMLVRHSCPRRL